LGAPKKSRLSELRVLEAFLFLLQYYSNKNNEMIFAIIKLIKKLLK